MEFEEKHKEVLNLCVTDLQESFECIPTYLKNDQTAFDALRNITKDYCNIALNFENHKIAFNKTKEYYADQENDCTISVENVYKKFLDELTPIAAPETHPIWTTIMKIDSKNNKNSDDEVGEEEEIDEGILPSQFTPPVDPITKQVIKNPYRNKKCQHVYDYATIIEHLNNKKNAKGKIRCPYIGCKNKNLTQASLVKDNKLKTDIEEYLTRNKSKTDSFNESNQTSF